MDRIMKLIQTVTRVIGIAFARLPSHRRPPELLAHPWFATVALLAANAALVAIVMRAPAGVGAQLGPVDACNTCYQGVLYPDGVLHSKYRIANFGVGNPGTDVFHGPALGQCDDFHFWCCNPN